MLELINSHILSLLILIPALGAVAALCWPSKNPQGAWRVGLAVAALELVASLHLPWHFETGRAALQFTEQLPWIPGYGVEFAVGLDGLSLYLVLLTTLLTPIILLTSASSVKHNVGGYVAAFLALEAGIIGALCAIDLFFFYVFWEAMLLPMFFIIGLWGGANRVYAAVKFILYTMVGSLPMLVAILYVYTRHGRTTGTWTFNIVELYGTHFSSTEQCWLFAAFALAFCIKVPLFPFHTWLPDAHTEAPTAGSVILAAVLLKLGGYGLLRFAIPLFPQAAAHWAPLLMVLATIGIIYGALVSRVQEDMKKLVAFSSVSHLGFAVLGFASGTPAGILGGMVVMISHGLTTGALFMLVGMLYERRHTRLMDDFGGLQAVMPRYTMVLRFVTFASVGLPGLSGFVGEFLVLYGASQNDQCGRIAAPVAALGMILSAVYMLSMFGRVMTGPVTHPENKSLEDATGFEIGTLAPLILFTVWLGLWPNTVLDKMRPTAQALSAVIGTKGTYSVEAKDHRGQVLFHTPHVNGTVEHRANGTSSHPVTSLHGEAVPGLH